MAHNWGHRFRLPCVRFQVSLLDQDKDRGAEGEAIPDEGGDASALKKSNEEGDRCIADDEGYDRRDYSWLPLDAALRIGAAGFDFAVGFVEAGGKHAR